MQESDTPHPGRQSRFAGLGWFVGGSLFGAVFLFCVLILATKGAVMDSLFASTDGETARMGVIRQAVRNGVADALADGGQRSGGPAATNQMGPPVPQQPATKSLIAGTVRAANLQGNPNAPVQIVEYGDFGCIFCTRFYQQTLSKVIDKYVKTGQANLVYKHFPIVSLHPAADLAAIASECAADQGKFWDYHNLLFERNTKGFATAALAQMATDLQMNLPTFNSCMTNGATSGRMTADMNEGRALNVGGTPTFFINGVAVVGAQPYEVFDRAISQALSKQQ